MDPLIIAAIGIFLGVLTRTGLPYLKKLRDAKRTEPPGTLDFDVMYAGTAIFSVVVSFVATMFLLPQFPILEEVPLLSFSNAFTTGFTANSIINDIIS